MKKSTNIFVSFMAMLCVVSCDNIDDWTTDPALEHVYYVGFYKTGTYSDKLNYEIAADGTARWRIGSGTWQETGTDNVSSDVPIQLHSERVRSYDVTAYFWVSNSGTSALVAGTDYTVVDESDAPLTLSDGKYSLTWPQAVKGTQVVRIKRLTATAGVLLVNTLDPAKGTPVITEESYIESTRNNLTGDYEVRGLSHDFNTVTISLK